MQKLIPVKDLILDAGTQIRVKLDEETLADYTEQYRKKEPGMPPIDVFSDGKKDIVADGFHRAHAAIAAEVPRILCTVHQGGIEKAMLFALSANAGHGLRRSNADKRNAVFTAIKRWPKKPNREIAEICAVSHRLVDNIRPVKETTTEDLAPVAKCKPSEEVTKSNEPEPPPSTEPEPPPNGEPAPPPGPEPPPAQATLALSNEVIFDEIGYPIPEAVEAVFKRKSELEEVVEHCFAIRRALEKARDASAEGKKDPLFTHVSDFSGLLADLNMVTTTLKGAVPYSVCLYCKGINMIQCPNCHHTGFMGRFGFERQTPIELQELRKKEVELLKKQRKEKHVKD